MKGSECKFVKYMEGSDGLSFRFIRETMTGKPKTASSCMMIL